MWFIVFTLIIAVQVALPRFGSTQSVHSYARIQFLDQTNTSRNQLTTSSPFPHFKPYFLWPPFIQFDQQFSYSNFFLTSQHFTLTHACPSTDFRP